MNFIMMWQSANVTFPNAYIRYKNRERPVLLKQYGSVPNFSASDSAAMESVPQRWLWKLRCME